jgi:hypothetical protein
MLIFDAISIQAIAAFAITPSLIFDYYAIAISPRHFFTPLPCRDAAAARRFEPSPLLIFSMFYERHFDIAITPLPLILRPH